MLCKLFQEFEQYGIYSKAKTKFKLTEINGYGALWSRNSDPSKIFHESEDLFFRDEFRNLHLI